MRARCVRSARRFSHDAAPVRRLLQTRNRDHAPGGGKDQCDPTPRCLLRRLRRGRGGHGCRGRRRRCFCRRRRRGGNDGFRCRRRLRLDRQGHDRPRGRCGHRRNDLGRRRLRRRLRRGRRRRRHLGPRPRACRFRGHGCSGPRGGYIGTSRQSSSPAASTRSQEGAAEGGEGQHGEGTAAPEQVVRQGASKLNRGHEPLTTPGWSDSAKGTAPFPAKTSGVESA